MGCWVLAQLRFAELVCRSLPSQIHTAHLCACRMGRLLVVLPLGFAANGRPWRAWHCLTLLTPRPTCLQESMPAGGRLHALCGRVAGVGTGGPIATRCQVGLLWPGLNLCKETCLGHALGIAPKLKPEL